MDDILVGSISKSYTDIAFENGWELEISWSKHLGVFCVLSHDNAEPQSIQAENVADAIHLIDAFFESMYHVHDDRYLSG